MSGMPISPLDQTRLTVALNALGFTADEVAESLRARGVRGLRLIPNMCPVANYLRMVLPDVTILGVLSDGVVVHNDDTDRMETVVNMPDPVGQFILHFDRANVAAWDDLFGSMPSRAQETAA